MKCKLENEATLVKLFRYSFYMSFLVFNSFIKRWSVLLIQYKNLYIDISFTDLPLF